MNKDFVLDFVAGGVSAAVSKTVVAPLERKSINKLLDFTRDWDKYFFEDLRIILNWYQYFLYMR
jgi:hypothetical protein